MYKLVVVGGKLRGEEFELVEGENVLGRDPDCDIHYAVQGVSKKHLMITVTGDAAYIQDLGSSNGTFLNGKVIKRATVENGDKIALPDSIVQVVYVEEKKIIIKRKIQEDDEEDDIDAIFAGGDPPASIFGKLIYYFKFKFMTFFHGLNEEYEWKILFGMLLTVFIFLSVYFTVTPVFESSRNILQYEISLRGRHYADEIARINSRALESKNLDQVETKFLEGEEGVESYELFDLKGRIVRPIGKLNENTSDAFSVRALDKLGPGKSRGKSDFYAERLDGMYGIAKKIKAYNTRLGVEETVGIIALKFRPQSLIASSIKDRKAFLEAIVTSLLAAILFFGIVYYLTKRPIDEIKLQIEEALRGKRRNLDTRYLMEELDELRSSINSILQRNRELQNDGESEIEELESDEKYVGILHQFMKGAGVPTMVLDSEKNLSHISMEAEDITGIRENSSVGMNLLDVAREKGFAATVIELCDSSAGQLGECSEGEYELSGIAFSIYTTSLMGKDNFAKAFYVTFVRND